MSISQLRRKIAHVNKLKSHAAKKRRPARVRHYDRIVNALALDLDCAIIMTASCYMNGEVA